MKTPGSRRQVAARRPGPARPRLGRRPHRRRGTQRPRERSSAPAPTRSSSRPRCSSAAAARPAASSSPDRPTRRRRSPARSSGMDIKGMTVRKVLVAPAADIVKEFYLAAVLDRADARILLMGSAEGGVEIETGRRATTRRRSSGATPTRSSGCSTSRRASWRSRWGSAATSRRRSRSPRASWPRCGPTTPTSSRSTRWRSSARPARTATPVERLVCLDAKITLDDSALARHPGLEDLRDPDEEAPDGPRGPRGRPDVHQARRHDRLHGQRRRPGDDDDGPRQAGRRRTGQLPRHRRWRARRQGRRTRCG